MIGDIKTTEGLKEPLNPREIGWAGVWTLRNTKPGHDGKVIGYWEQTGEEPPPPNSWDYLDWLRIQNEAEWRRLVALPQNWHYRETVVPSP